MNPTPVYLQVPPEEVQAVLALSAGAKWDGRPEVRAFYLPEGVDPAPYRRWLAGAAPAAPTAPAAPAATAAEPSAQATLFRPAEAGDENPAEEPAAVAPVKDEGVSLLGFLQRVQQAVATVAADRTWVRAEISELRAAGRNGHVYGVLVEHDDKGQVVAKVNSSIWAAVWAKLDAKFREATGASLAAGQKVLLQVSGDFHASYGMRLSIYDVDPAYTLGDMEAKLQRIRERLTAEGLWGQNKSLPAPSEFTRVAVIAPRSAAGLDDFNKDIERLQRHGLCSFTYFQAVFQGEKAVAEVGEALARVAAAHAQQGFDALVIIRGGGAVTDMAWLNDYELAAALCRAPLPVLTGIGHERDNTILDEVACVRLGTPSKVSAHVVNTIFGNAQKAENAWESIVAMAKRACDVGAREVQAALRSIEHGAVALLRLTEEKTAAHHDQILQMAPVRLEQAEQAAEKSWTQVEHGATRAVADAVAAAERLWQPLPELAERHLRVVEAQFEPLWSELCRLATEAPERAAERIDALIAEILGLGPAATLRRGFAIVRDASGAPLSSVAAAAIQSSLELEMRDGKISITPSVQGA